MGKFFLWGEKKKRKMPLCSGLVGPKCMNLKKKMDDLSSSDLWPLKFQVVMFQTKKQSFSTIFQKKKTLNTLYNIYIASNNQNNDLKTNN
jgi:hypothetical protein